MRETRENIMPTTEKKSESFKGWWLLLLIDRCRIDYKRFLIWDDLHQITFNLPEWLFQWMCSSNLKNVFQYYWFINLWKLFLTTLPIKKKILFLLFPSLLSPQFSAKYFLNKYNISPSKRKVDKIYISIFMAMSCFFHAKTRGFKWETTRQKYFA